MVGVGCGFFLNMQIRKLYPMAIEAAWTILKLFLERFRLCSPVICWNGTLTSPMGNFF